jgi:crotonobetainyl-CoA:carnitine CoA-transferase CaiB-like acyl-CoA transferase
VDILEGFRVIDLTMWAFVPSAGAVLAHWGADVIKVESPTAPDPVRLFGGSLEPGGASWLFKHYSRGKRGITLDLTTDDGREALYRLVETADVFLTSFLPETRRKLKVDVDDIRARNERIIYARGTGQGPRGPEAERGGYDGATWWCRGGLAETAREFLDSEWPPAPGMVGHGDGMSGMTLAGGICAALLKRERTGRTSVVDGSLMGTALWFNGPAVIAAKLYDAPWTTDVPHAERAANDNMYRTKDGRFLIFAHLGDFDVEWADLCDHLGRPELASDARFATAAVRAQHRGEAVAIFDEVIASKTLEEWKSILVTTKGVWSAVQTAREVHDDPQTIANGFVRDVEYPDGPLALPAPPLLFDEEAGDPPRAPDFGEHTDEVLGEVGYDAAAIAGLRQAGVIS